MEKKETTRYVGHGLGLGTILFVVFLVLKLTDKIDWSWFWVVFPLWAGPAAAIGFVLFIFIVVLVIAAIMS